MRGANESTSGCRGGRGGERKLKRAWEVRGRGERRAYCNVLCRLQENKRERERVRERVRLVSRKCEEVEWR